MSPCVQPDTFGKVPAIHLKSEISGEDLLVQRRWAAGIAQL